MSACLSDVDLATCARNVVYAWTLQGFIYGFIVALKFEEYGRYLLCCVVNRVYIFLLSEVAYFVSTVFYERLPWFLLSPDMSSFRLIGQCS